MHHFKDSKAFKNERQLPTDLCSHGTDSKKTTDGQKIKKLKIIIHINFSQLTL